MARVRDRPQTKVLPSSQRGPQSAAGRNATVDDRSRDIDQTMEKPGPFVLNEAIRRWREHLSRMPSLRRENLDELELHLRDAVTTLQARGLSEEEAWLTAY